MKALRLTMFALVCIQLLACQAEDSSTTESEEVEAPSAEAEPMPWTFLTAGVYHNNATVVIGQDPGDNPNKGFWMDLHDNGTYDYGRYETKEGTGTWFYDHDNSLLELTPGGNRPASEWRIMSRDDNLILVGTAKHGNNAQQQRYTRREGLPSRPD